MSLRYLIIGLASEIGSARIERLVEASGQVLGLRTVLRTATVLVLANDQPQTFCLGENAGVVLGDLFERGGSGRPVLELAPEHVRSLVESRGDHLIEKFWGEYIAVIAAGTGYVVRDPMGAVPCYQARANGWRICFSHIDIPLQLGLLDCAPDWEMVAWTAASYDMSGARTCVTGVDEVLPGVRLSLSDGAQNSVWTPWAFLDRRLRIETWDEAVGGLRREVDSVTRALARTCPKAVVEISGGLDSSIVAASLKGSGMDLRCVTLATPDPGADERRYAQAMADYIGAPLTVVFLSPTDLALTDTSPTLKPRPSDHPLKRFVDVALSRSIGSEPIGAFYSGSGGDHVLGYFGTSAPAADALRTHGPSRTFFSAAADIAKLHRTSVWKAGALAMKKAARGNVRARRPLSPFVLRRAWPVTEHPWWPAPAKALPGSVAQVVSLIAAKDVRDGRDRSLIAPNRTPLLTQPVVEHCLRIPSWMAVSQGRNRAVARDAFRDVLPPLVVDRTTKGDFRGLLGELFLHNRALIRELLLEGRLRAEKIIDVAAVEAALDPNRLHKDSSFNELLTLSAIELWAGGMERAGRGQTAIQCLEASRSPRNVSQRLNWPSLAGSASM